MEDTEPKSEATPCSSEPGTKGPGHSGTFEVQSGNVMCSHPPKGECTLHECVLTVIKEAVGGGGSVGIIKEYNFIRVLDSF